MIPTKTINFLVFACLFFCLSARSQGFLPKSIMMMDDKFSHHAIVVEKSSHKLFLYANNNGIPRLVTSFQIATGKNTGDKLIEGDEKTPEGFYQLNKFFPAEYLLKTYGDYGKIYGSGAFVLNYPNIVDRLQGKTGGGIWLHSTDDESRISKGLDSRGCVVLGDRDLKEISRYIDLDTKTPIIIEDSITYWSEATWQKNKEQVNFAVQNWLGAWNKTQLKIIFPFITAQILRIKKA